MALSIPHTFAIGYSGFEGYNGTQTDHKKGQSSVNWGVFLLLTGFVIVALLLVQRTEAKRRRLAILLIAFVGFLGWYWAGIRALSAEFGYSLLCGGFFSIVFWALIGRYNPVADSDETIQVLGMDD